MDSKPRHSLFVAGQSLLIFLILYGCVDRASFDSTTNELGDVVVDGVITNEPGPYSIKLSRPSQPGSLLGVKTISNARITLLSSAGEVETFKETSVLGTYKTDPNGMRGVIGREYWVKIELPDGRIFESQPDKMNPVGRVDSVYYKFESLVADNGKESYGFRIFTNATYPEGENKYIRLKFDGVYAVNTLPQLHAIRPEGSSFCTVPDPRPCSGYVLYYGNLISLGPCTCCACWVSQFEQKPFVKDGVNESEIRNVQIGFVPINFYTFQDKYKITITEMSLSKRAYSYWNTVQTQKENATSLFQPSYGKTESNMFEPSNKGKVIGIFYASAISKKGLTILKETNKAYLLAEAPVDCSGRSGPASESCLALFPGSTNVKPDDWD